VKEILAKKAMTGFLEEQDKRASGPRRSIVTSRTDRPARGSSTRKGAKGVPVAKAEKAALVGKDNRVEKEVTEPTVVRLDS
jgi:hypothetical protein